MHKVLIVDDDMLVRMDLRSLVDWDALGIELTEDASNGGEALALLRQCRPDLVLLDIEMPVMSGIDLLRRLKEEKFEGKVIVLSCHDDFKTVREALKIGAHDYILKDTITADSLRRVLQQSLQSLQEENEVRNLTRINSQTLHESYIKDVFAGVCSAEELTSKKIQYAIAHRFRKFVAAVVQVDRLHQLKGMRSKAEWGHLLRSAADLMREALKGSNCLYGTIEEGRYGLLFDLDEHGSFMQQNRLISETCERILDNFNKYLNVPVSIGISSVGDQFAHAADYCAQAKMALDGKLYLGTNRMIHFTELERYNNKADGLLSRYEHAFEQAVLCGAEPVAQVAFRLFDELRQGKIKPAHIRTLGVELLMFVYRLLKECRLENMAVFGTDELPYQDVLQLETLQDMEEWAVSIFQSIRVRLNQRVGTVQEKELRPEIRKALHYIEQHYKRDIPLQEIADYAKLSRTYFSQIFCQEVEIGFSEYLARYRIEKAKLLLRNSDLKVYEVGIACGIPNYRYFTRLFKATTGSSPVSYKYEIS